MAVKVEIQANAINLRTTALRAQLSNVVAIKKCGDKEELREALKGFDKALCKWVEVIS